MGSKKIALIAIPIIIVAAILVIFVLPLISSSPPAILIVDNQPVDINSGSGYVTASSNMRLGKDSSVRTGPGGSASIVLYGSSVVRLDENTEVKISELIEGEQRSVSLEQSTGRTWNKVTKLSGFKDYTIETPTAVASIRGTAFAVKADETSTVDLVEGQLSLSSKGESQQSITLEADQSAKVEVGNIETKVLVQDEFISSNVKKDQQFVEDTKAKLKSKYATYIQIAKSTYGLTDEEIDQYIDKYLSGEFTEEQIRAAEKQFGIKISA